MRVGGEVTAVCSTRSVARATSLGADHIVEDFTRGARRYNVLFDNAGNRSWSDYARVLTPTATAILVGGPITNRLLGPLGHIARMRLAAARSGRKAVFFIASDRERQPTGSGVPARTAGNREGGAGA